MFFSFNHSGFQNRLDLIKALINEFDQHLDQLINSVYLMLRLREIHDTRKWNSFLHLKETTSSSNSGCDASINNSFMRNSHESSDESVMTQRNETWIENVVQATQINSGEAALPVPNDMNPLSKNQGESSLDLSASYAKSSNTNSQQSSAAVKLMNSNITRRPSFASMDDTDRGKFHLNKSFECLV